MENRLVIAGTVASSVETRYSPAGIPISRFRLRHQSQQLEAGMPRKVECTVAVMACGAELEGVARTLGEGDPIRVSGFISRADNRQGEFRLVLHAQRIDPHGTGENEMTGD